MGMVTFRDVFFDLAMRETRTLFPLEVGGPLVIDKRQGLMLDEYYCDERGCDCRRIIVIVRAAETLRSLAVISHSFEPPDPESYVKEQTFLDPLHPQSERAPELMGMFLDHIEKDPEYRQRLIRHYQMVKDQINSGRKPKRETSVERGGGRSQIIPPPPRRGRRKWR